MIDVLAGIPPVVYGVWGILAVVPFISEKLAPHFVEFSTGYSILAGGIVLAIMIIPLMISVFIEIFGAMPTGLREASLSLGATNWQTVKKVVLRKSFPGIAAAVVLAISRAFGETIAVLMVCGNVSGAYCQQLWRNDVDSALRLGPHAIGFAPFCHHPDF
jgi:phosphate transport system permease protein